LKEKKKEEEEEEEEGEKEINKSFPLSHCRREPLARSRFNEAKSLMRGARGLAGRKGPEVTACNNYGALSAT
jgi:hypothetical protein